MWGEGERGPERENDWAHIECRVTFARGAFSGWQEHFVSDARGFLGFPSLRVLVSRSNND